MDGVLTATICDHVGTPAQGPEPDEPVDVDVGRDPVDRSEDLRPIETPSLVAAVVCTIGTIGLFIAPGPLWNHIQLLVGTIR